MDQRPDLDEVRGLLHKVTSSGKRKGGATLSPYGSRPSVDTLRQNPPPPLPLQVVPSTSQGSFAPPPSAPSTRHPRSTAPGSPSSISTGQVEEYSYQTMMPPARTQNHPPGVQVEEDEGERRWEITSNNPYKSQGSPQPGFQPSKRD